MVIRMGNKNRMEMPIGTVVLSTIFIFLVIYNISFKFVPIFTSARVAILLLGASFVVRGLKYPFKIGHYPFLILTFLLPVLGQHLFSGDSTQTSRIVHLFFYSFVGASLLSALSGSLKVALFSYTAAVSVQAVIIIVVFFNIELREIIDSFIVVGGNFGVYSLYRAPGFTSSSGADLSVIQAMGVVSGILFLYTTKINSYFLQNALVFFLIIICGISTLFVGRTGLLISAVFIFGYLFFSFSIIKIKNWAYICLGIIIIYTLISSWSFYVSRIDNFNEDYFLDWAFGSFIGKDTSVDDIANQPIPPISIETVFGTGMVTGPDGIGNASGHDSGYVQTYYSMGLILSVTFYLFLAYVLALYVKGHGVIAWLLFMVIFVIELKEPFIFKYNVILLLMLAYYASSIESMSVTKSNSAARRGVFLKYL